MDMRTVTTERAPQAIGPYSQALVAGGVVYCSGQIGLDPGTGQLAGDGAAAEARRALLNLDGVLTAAGSDRGRVVKVTLYLTDLGDFEVVNGVYAEYFGPHRPARATVQVSRLPKGAKVELDAIALAPNNV
jgi:2-iminobutanoate/2-iminopropanoate deaminase